MDASPLTLTDAFSLRADHAQPCTVDTHSLPWLASPEATVHRRLLERLGGEVARATSVVRYEPGARFDSHVHAQGEEILVLDGVFSDRSGDFPAGTYLRNPPGSSHAPWSVPGCVLFVKLRYHDGGDLQTIRTDTAPSALAPVQAGMPVLGAVLHEHEGHRTQFLHWQSAAPWPAFEGVGGFEAFVVSGELQCNGHAAPAGTWLRRPPGERVVLRGEAGTRVLVKTGHLACAHRH